MSTHDQQDDGPAERLAVYVEVWTGGSFLAATESYGWQCFTCRQEADGFETFDVADAAADEHRRACPSSHGQSEAHCEP